MNLVRLLKSKSHLTVLLLAVAILLSAKSGAADAKGDDYPSEMTFKSSWIRGLDAMREEFGVTDPEIQSALDSIQNTPDEYYWMLGFVGEIPPKDANQVFIGIYDSKNKRSNGEPMVYRVKGVDIYYSLLISHFFQRYSTITESFVEIDGHLTTSLRKALLDVMGISADFGAVDDLMNGHSKLVLSAQVRRGYFTSRAILGGNPASFRVSHIESEARVQKQELDAILAALRPGILVDRELERAFFAAKNAGPRSFSDMVSPELLAGVVSTITTAVVNMVLTAGNCPDCRGTGAQSVVYTENAVQRFGTCERCRGTGSIGTDTPIEIKVKAPEVKAAPMPQKPVEGYIKSQTELFEKIISGHKNTITLPSGLAYEILETGSGVSPKPGDTVRLHFIGRQAEMAKKMALSREEMMALAARVSAYRKAHTAPEDQEKIDAANAAHTMPPPDVMARVRSIALPEDLKAPRKDDRPQWSVFYDSTAQKRKSQDAEATPIDFELDSIPGGWSEGLQHVGVGGKIILYLPPQFSLTPYQRFGFPRSEVLSFEITLLSIQPPG